MPQSALQATGHTAGNSYSPPETGHLTRGVRKMLECFSSQIWGYMGYCYLVFKNN